MPKITNLTMHKERRLRRNFVVTESSHLMTSPLGVLLPNTASTRLVSNEELREVDSHRKEETRVPEEDVKNAKNDEVTPSSSSSYITTKFNEDGTYRIDHLLSTPLPNHHTPTQRLVRSCSSTLLSSTSSPAGLGFYEETGCSARSLQKQSSGSLKRCKVDLTDIVMVTPTFDDENFTPNNHDIAPRDHQHFIVPNPSEEECAPSESFCNQNNTWGHFIDETDCYLMEDTAPRWKRRRIHTWSNTSKNNNEPLQGFFLASVEETAQGMERLRF